MTQRPHSTPKRASRSFVSERHLQKDLFLLDVAHIKVNIGVKESMSMYSKLLKTDKVFGIYLSFIDMIPKWLYCIKIMYSKFWSNVLHKQTLRLWVLSNIAETFDYVHCVIHAFLGMNFITSWNFYFIFTYMYETSSFIITY